MQGLPRNLLPRKLLNFNRHFRLTRKQDFQHVFAKPEKVTRKHMLALYRTNSLPHARLGIIIAKHLAKRAVDRNRIRRLVRESFRCHKDNLAGLDIVLMVRAGWQILDNQALRDEVEQLWQAMSPQK